MRLAIFAVVLMAGCADGGAPVASGFGAELNSFRAAQGAGPVAPNARLQRTAQAHASDMEQRGYFSHQSPGGPNGTGMSDRVAASGYRACAAAENIAQGQDTEAEVMAAWRASSGHRRNMLGARYADYGLGRSGEIWVLLLAAGC